MRFLDLKKELGDEVVFTTNDIQKISGNFSHRRLTEWQQKNYIKKIKKGCYFFSDRSFSEESLFVVANRIYSPSYISLESALRYYNLIPEGVFKIISVSTKKTTSFDNELGVFEYRNIKPSSFFEYNVIESNYNRFKIATVEKAIIDYFYFYTNLKTPQDFESLRINKDILLEKININRLEKNLQEIGNKNLQKRVSNFLKFSKNA